jgi:hypothetical protein
MTSLEKMEPDTEATPAFSISAFARLRLSRMISNSGAAAKVETKQVKKEIHERRKVRMYGLANEKSLMDSALFFESTGSQNFLAAACR